MCSFSAGSARDIICSTLAALKHFLHTGLARTPAPEDQSGLVMAKGALQLYKQRAIPSGTNTASELSSCEALHGGPPSVQ